MRSFLSSAQGYCKKSLSNRFRNSRKCYVYDNPLAQMEKTTQVTTPKPYQAIKQMYGIKNYLPAPPQRGQMKEPSVNICVSSPLLLFLYFSYLLIFIYCVCVCVFLRVNVCFVMYACVYALCMFGRSILSSLLQDFYVHRVYCAIGFLNS